MSFKHHGGYVQPSSENSACLRLHWYGSEPHRYSEEQLQWEPVQEFPHLWLCGWPDLSQLILEPTLFCKDAVLNRYAESSSNFDLIYPVPWHAYERNALAIAEWMLLLLPHFLAF